MDPDPRPLNRQPRHGFPHGSGPGVTVHDDDGVRPGPGTGFVVLRPGGATVAASSSGGTVGLSAVEVDSQVGGVAVAGGGGAGGSVGGCAAGVGVAGGGWVGGRVHRVGADGGRRGAVACDVAGAVLAAALRRVGALVDGRTGGGAAGIVRPVS
jgi:hypothetical protein